MKFQRKLLAILLAPLITHWAFAQPSSEATEMSPESLDAAFTQADATREAALWSDEEIVHGPVDPLGRMSAESDHVLIGTVTGQQIVYDASDTPFTHTTLAINDVLEGSYADSEITIVEQGGPLKDKPQNVLILSHTHYFTPGQEELLFLELDPDSPYPQSRVVIKNRFGVLGGRVFSESGRGLIYTETKEAPGYTLSFSRDRNPHPRFTEFKIGPHEFSKQFSEPHERGGPPDRPLSTVQKPVRPGYEASVEISTLKTAMSRQGG